MYCTNCGNKLDQQEKYCTYCGTACEKEELETKSINHQNNDSVTIILGVLACIFFWMPVFSIPLAIISIILGINQKKITNKTSTGTILGIISIILTAIATIALILLLVFAVNQVDEFIDDYQKDNIIDNFNEYYNRQNIDDDIKGYSWSVNNESLLYLNSDYTYIWYENDNNDKDNYEKGEFKTFRGEKAVEYIANTLKEFGISEEEQESIFKNKNYNINDYYLLILTSNEIKKSGMESQNITNTKYYCGIYQKEEKRIDFINMSTKEKVIFTRKEKLSNIDV